MDQETMKQFAELLAANNKAIFAEMQQLRADVKQDIGGMQQEIQQLRADVKQDIGGMQQEIQQLRDDMHDMFLEQTEGLVRVAKRMDDISSEKTAETVMRHMKVYIENGIGRQIQALYEDHEALKEEVRKPKAVSE